MLPLVLAITQSLTQTPTQTIQIGNITVPLNQASNGQSTTVDIMLRSNQLRIVWDTPKRKLGVGRLEGKPGWLHEFEPGTDRHIGSFAQTLHHNDGGTYMTGNPDDGVFAIEGDAVAMSLEIHRGVVLGPRLRPIPLDLAFIMGIDRHAVLGAPDVNRSPEARYSQPGPLALVDYHTGKTLWRRWDITTRNASLRDDHVLVRLSDFKNAFQVLDRKTGKTIYAYPPKNLQIGPLTVDPWPDPRPDNSFDYKRLSDGLANLEYSLKEGQTNLWNSPTRLLTIEKTKAPAPMVVFEKDRASGQVLRALTLPKWFQPGGTYSLAGSITLTNSPDTDLFALNLSRAGQDTTFVFNQDAPPLELPDFSSQILTPTETIGILNPSHTTQVIASFNPQTGQKHWTSPQLGQIQQLLADEAALYASHVLPAETGKTITAINRQNGRVVWERTLPITDRLTILLRPNGLLLREYATQNTSDRLTALDLQNGRTLGSTPIPPGPTFKPEQP